MAHLPLLNTCATEASKYSRFFLMNSICIWPLSFNAYLAFECSICTGSSQGLKIPPPLPNVGYVCRFINGYKVKFLKVSKNGISFWRTKLICGTLDNPSVFWLLEFKGLAIQSDVGLLPEVVALIWMYLQGFFEVIEQLEKKYFFMPFFFSSSLLEVGGKKVIIQEICEIKFSVRCTYC